MPTPTSPTRALIALALVLAPFVLAGALKFVPEWRDLWIPTLGFGIATIVAAVVGEARSGLALPRFWVCSRGSLGSRSWQPECYGCRERQSQPCG
jgi:hypothetical protein